MKRKQMPLIGILLIIVLCGVVALSVISIIGNKIDDDKYFQEQFSEIEYKIPPEFTQTFDYNYSYNGDEISCSIFMNATPNSIDNFKYWFHNGIYANLNSEISELEEFTVSGKEALHLDVNAGYNIRSYYGFKSSNYYYMIEFNTYDFNYGDGTQDTVCANAQKYVIDSLKIK